MTRLRPKILYLVTEDWYFCSHRLPLARAAQNAGFEIGVVTRVERDGERIRSEGFKLIPLDMRRGEIRLFRELRTLFRLWRIFRTERPMIVHNVAIKPVVLGTFAARMAGVSRIVNALAGLGYVFTSRELKASVLRSFVRLAFRLLFRNPAVYVIVQNSIDGRMLEQLGVGAENIELVPGSGVDLSIFRPLPEPGGPITIAMVARMLWDKGVGDLVDAARIVKAWNRDVRIVLVGPVDPANPTSIPETSLKAWIRDGLVKWAGATRDVPSVWARAHIGVLPSYREGLPKSLLEAAACGRPLIATDVPGCRDIVIHENTGLLVPPHDPGALAEAIIRLASDASLRLKLGKAARARVESHFTVEHITRQTVSLYRSLRETG